MSVRIRHELLRELLENSPSVEPKLALTPDLLSAAVHVGEALLTGNWTEVRRRAEYSLGLGIAAHGMLRSRAPDRGTLLPSVVAQLLGAVLREAARSPERKELISTFREALSDREPEDIARLEPSLNALAEGKIAGVPILQELANRGPLALPLDGLDAALSAMTQGLLGRIHHEFNQAYIASEDRIARLLRPELEGAVAQSVTEFEQNLTRRQSQLQGCLMRSAEDSSVQAAIHELWDFAAVSAPRFARVQAAAHLAATTLREKGRGGAARDLGQHTAAAGSLTREAVASAVASQRLAVDLALAHSSGGTIELVSQARRLPFEQELPHGKDTALRHLPDTSEGVFVEIWGFVESFRAFRESDGKLVSHIHLVDAPSGIGARATAIFINAERLGLTTGSFCRLSGTTRRLGSGGDAIIDVLIHRLPQAELSKSQWRFALVHSAERWLERFPGGHNITWAIGPHDTAVPLGDGSQAGAAELVFGRALR